MVRLLTTRVNQSVLLPTRHHGSVAPLRSISACPLTSAPTTFAALAQGGVHSIGNANAPRERPSPASSTHQLRPPSLARASNPSPSLLTRRCLIPCHHVPPTMAPRIALLTHRALVASCRVLFCRRGNFPPVRVLSQQPAPRSLPACSQQGRAAALTRRHGLTPSCRLGLSHGLTPSLVAMNKRHAGYVPLASLPLPLLPPHPSPDPQTNKNLPLVLSPPLPTAHLHSTQPAGSIRLSHLIGPRRLLLSPSVPLSLWFLSPSCSSLSLAPRSLYSSLALVSFPSSSAPVSHLSVPPPLCFPLLSPLSSHSLCAYMQARTHSPPTTQRPRVKLVTVLKTAGPARASAGLGPARQPQPPAHGSPPRCRRA